MKKIITSSAAPAPIGPYNQAVFSRGVLYVSGQIAINPQTGKVEDQSIEAETLQVMKNLRAIIEEAGMGFENVVKCSIFITNMDDFKAINKVYGQFFNQATAPARETVQVAQLPKRVRVEISAIAVKEEKGNRR